MKEITDNTIYFAKSSNLATIPTKRDEDAGYDLFPIINGLDLRLYPGQIAKINTGVCTAFSKDYMFIVKERSSTGKHGLAIRMGVVDSGYRGEICICVNNTSGKTIVITNNINKDYSVMGDVVLIDSRKAIAQGLIVPCPTMKTAVIDVEELQNIPSSRSTNREGSTDKV